MSGRLGGSWWVTTVCLGLIGLMVVSADADTYTGQFALVPGSDTLPGNYDEAAFLSQFSVEVGVVPSNDPAGAYDGLIFFTFSNTGTYNGIISEVYWDWADPPGADLDGDPLLIDPDLLPYWTEGAAPSSLPGGENIDFAAVVAADPDSKPAKYGIGGSIVGSSGTFYMAYSGEWATLNELLENGSVCFGIHVIGLDEGLSVSMFSPPTVVPVPAAAGLGLLGIGVVSAIRARNRRAA